MKFQTPIKRAIIYLFVVFISLGILSQTVEAHSSLEGTKPKGGSKLEEIPSKIEAWFQDPVEIHSESVVIEGERGLVNVKDINFVNGDKTHIQATISSNLTPGSYTVKLNTIALDGYVLKEQFQFEVLVPKQEDKPSETKDDEKASYGTIELVKASPADGQIAKGETDKLDLWFNQPVDISAIGIFNDNRTPIQKEIVIDQANPHHITAYFETPLQPGSYQVSWLVKPIEKEQVASRMGVYYFAIEQFTHISGDQAKPTINMFFSIGLKEFAYWIMFVGGSFLLGITWFNNFIHRLDGQVKRQTLSRLYLTILFSMGALLYLATLNKELPDLNIKEIITFKIAWLPLMQVSLLWIGLFFRKSRILMYGLAVILFSFYSGHSSYPRYGGLLSVSVNTLHLLAISIWLGGLASLILFIPKEEKGKWFKTSIKAFSRWALICVLVISLTGIWMTVSFVPKFSIESFVQSIWGKTILFKMAFFLFMAVLGYLIRRSLNKRADLIKQTGLKLKLELFYGFILLFLAAILVVATPSAAEQGIYPEQVTTEDITLNVNIEPLKLGYNEFTLTFEDGKEIENVDILLSMPPDWQKVNTAFRIDQETFKLTGMNLHAAGTVLMEVIIVKANGQEITIPFKIVVPGEIRYNE